MKRVVLAAMMLLVVLDASARGFGGGFGGRGFGGGFRSWSSPSRSYTPPKVYRPVTPPTQPPKPYVAPPAPKPVPATTYKPVEKPKTLMEQRKPLSVTAKPKQRPKTVLVEKPKTFNRTTVSYSPSVSRIEQSSGPGWLTWGILGYVLGSSMNGHAAPTYQPAYVTPPPQQASPYRNDTYLYAPASSVAQASPADASGTPQSNLGSAWNW